MGFNNEGAAKLVFDVETCPLDDAAAYLEPVEAPSNYRDPEKVKSYIAEKQGEQLAKCALDVDLCRVVAIGVWDERGSPVAWDAREKDSEQEGLEWFWSWAGARHLVGYNVLAFDLPVLLRRSLYLGVPTPKIQIDRFKHPQVTDLMDELSYGGKLRLRGLSFFCRRFGIDVPDALTGADIGQAVAEGRWADVEAHVLADVRKTALLAEKLGHFRCAVEAAF